jgi:arabinose-5-phosphate isomerase
MDEAAEALEVARDVVTIEAAGLDALKAGFAEPSSALATAFLRALSTVQDAKGRVVVTGMGKSGHVARKIAATLASTGTRAGFVHSAEASHGDLGMISEADVVLALSNSGETPELGDVIAYCGRFSIPLIAITGKPDSTLGRAAGTVLPLPDTPEACAETRAPTTSTTLSMVIGDALAVALLRRRGFTGEDFKTFHPGGKLGASLRRVADMMHEGRELPLVPLGTAVPEAVRVLSGAGFGCVGVTEAGRLVGIVTDGDLRRHANEGLRDLIVDQVMTRGPKVVTPQTLAAEALGILSRTKITALFVVEGETPVGLIHVHDVLDAGVL